MYVHDMYNAKWMCLHVQWWSGSTIDVCRDLLSKFYPASGKLSLSSSGNHAISAPLFISTYISLPYFNTLHVTGRYIGLSYIINELEKVVEKGMPGDPDRDLPRKPGTNPLDITTTLP